jgi:hypothetical protein
MRFLLVIFFFSSYFVSAQKIVKTYYDPMHRHVEEEYVASAADGQTLDGAYRKYFENGKLAIEGTLKMGCVGEPFMNITSNGTLIRKIDYEMAYVTAQSKCTIHRATLFKVPFTRTTNWWIA